MLYNPKNGTVVIGETDMDFISFGVGKKILVMLPGLGDALKTVKGMAIPFLMMYKDFTKKFTVYAFSRKTL